MFKPLSVAAACNSKLKERQKRLRSARPQALLIRAPKGAWITSCMPPPSSKKRSAITVVCVGTVPRRLRPSENVFDDLLGAGIVQTAFALEPVDRRRERREFRAGGMPGSVSIGEIADGFAEVGELRGEFLGAAGSFAEPERNAGRGAVRVFDEHGAGVARGEFSRSVAEENDVAGKAFDGEILVDGADGAPSGMATTL